MQHRYANLSQDALQCEMRCAQCGGVRRRHRPPSSSRRAPPTSACRLQRRQMDFTRDSALHLRRPRGNITSHSITHRMIYTRSTLHRRISMNRASASDPASCILGSRGQILVHISSPSTLKVKHPALLALSRKSTRASHSKPHMLDAVVHVA